MSWDSRVRSELLVFVLPVAMVCRWKLYRNYQVERLFRPVIATRKWCWDYPGGCWKRAGGWCLLLRDGVGGSASYLFVDTVCCELMKIMTEVEVLNICLRLVHNRNLTLCTPPWVAEIEQLPKAILAGDFPENMMMASKGRFERMIAEWMCVVKKMERGERRCSRVKLRLWYCNCINPVCITS